MIWKCASYSLNLDKPNIMGILNITPDSFSDGSKYFNSQDAIRHLIDLQNQGANIIDVGAQSTRPGFSLVSEEEEFNRLEPFFFELKKNKNNIKIPLSIDTFYPNIAIYAIKNGFSIINDVKSFLNPKMLEILINTNVGIILMHNTESWNEFLKNYIHENHIEDNIIKKIIDFFYYSLSIFNKKNININRICLDPGIGFGKSMQENFVILNNLKKISVKNLPVLVGTSKKRITTYNLTLKNDKDLKAYSNKSIELMAINNGANILRVHLVNESIELLKFINF